MKICELKINNYTDRQMVILGLVNSGYKVYCENRLEEPDRPYSSKTEVIIVVEEIEKRTY